MKRPLLSLLQAAAAHLLMAGLLCLGGCSEKVMMSRQNLAEFYNGNPEQPLQLDYRVLADSLEVYVQLGPRLPLRDRNPGNLSLQYRIMPNYDSEVALLTDSVQNLLPLLRRQTLPQPIVRFAIARQWLAPGRVLKVQYLDRITQQRHTLDLPLTAHSLNKRYLLLNGTTRLPLFRHAFNPADTLVISPSTPADTLQARRYEIEFKAALPPMTMRPAETPKTIPVKERYQVQADRKVYFVTPGFYSLHFPDGSTGVVLLEENRFPQLTTASELIEPLIYITTSKERQDLYKATEPKKAVDRFWLDIAGNQEFARTLIRTYYTRVENANRLFSSHKAGWMTDRGMIYIVLGRPAEVYHFADREEWHYPANEVRPAVKFVFLRKENPLTINHYELVRDPVFEPVWYRQAEQWRKGIIDK